MTGPDVHPPAATPVRPAPTVAHPVAGLDRRFYAFAIDRALAWAWYAVAGLAAWSLLDDRPWLVVAVIAGVVVVTSLGLAVLLGARGTSPGKASVGLRVVHDGSGTPIGVGRAVLRTLVLVLASVPTFGLGLASLAWTAVADPSHQRRGWHDHLARSVVVDVRPVPVVAEAPAEEAQRHVVNLTAMRLVPAPAVPAPAPPGVPSGARRVSRPAAPVPHPAGPRWRVTLDSGESFVVEGLVLVGRRPEPRAGEDVRHLVPLRSADMSVSKTHAQLAPADDGVLVVTDRGSTNGSLLVRQGVARRLAAGKPATLLDGDQVSFGDRRITVARES